MQEIRSSSLWVLARTRFGGLYSSKFQYLCTVQSARVQCTRVGYLWKMEDVHSPSKKCGRGSMYHVGTTSTKEVVSCPWQGHLVTPEVNKNTKKEAEERCNKYGSASHTLLDRIVLCDWGNSAQYSKSTEIERYTRISSEECEARISIRLWGSLSEKGVCLHARDLGR